MTYYLEMLGETKVGYPAFLNERNQMQVTYFGLE